VSRPYAIDAAVELDRYANGERDSVMRIARILTRLINVVDERTLAQLKIFCIPRKDDNTIQINPEGISPEEPHHRGPVLGQDSLSERLAFRKTRFQN